MPTYNAAAVSDSVIAHKKGITLQTGRALRDNPEAVRDGDATAPRIGGRALNTFTIDYVQSASTSATNVLNLDRFAHIRFDFSGTSSGLTLLQIAFSDNNGSSFGSWQQLLFMNEPYVMGAGFFNMQTGAFRWHGVFIDPLNASQNRVEDDSGTLTVPSDANAISLRMDNTLGSIQFMGWCLGGRL